ncbi:Transcription initiation factor IIB-1 [Durusdinium trenchii]|uniref:Transcription initiation factor IIB-1 n=1 Tax=Durusdinium trenchii TaxID=1381693 RepID=A0ABP0IZ83_9DINO
MASAIFVVAWLLDVEKKPRLEDVAKAAKVSEGYAKVQWILPAVQSLEMLNKL